MNGCSEDLLGTIILTISGSMIGTAITFAAFYAGEAILHRLRMWLYRRRFK